MEDVLFRIPGNSPLAGEYRSRDAVFAAMRQFEKRSGGTIRVDVHDIPASNEHAVALLRASSVRPGTSKRLDRKEIQVVYISDGKISEVWAFAENQRINDAYWSD